MKNIYKRLTNEQRDAGVLMTSTLSYRQVESVADTTHTVTKEEFDNDQSEALKKIERLKDASFFKNSHWKYNVIRD